MSKIERLIEELCPDGVEYKKIKDIANYEQPSKYLVKSTEYKDSNKIPVLTAGQTFILGYTDETKGIYCASKKEPVIIFDDFTGAFKWVDFPFKAKSSAMKMITVKKGFLIRYLYHIMGYLNFSSNEHKRLWINKYSELYIPVPPLSIQEEIVRILDSFTELKAQLEEELEARKKQYEWYKEKLLEFGNNVEYKYLYECLLKVSNIKWIQTDTEYKYIDLTSVDINRHQIKEIKKINKENAPSRAKQIVHCEDVIFATTRPTLKRYYFVGHEYNNQICSTGFCVLRANDKFVLPKWIYYLISSKKFSYYVEQNQEGASYPSISDSKVKNFKIPLPPLEEQQRIVDILNRFDKLCNDISEGLPAEIDARQKQYEYYRDKLLTFKRLGK